MKTPTSYQSIPPVERHHTHNVQQSMSSSSSSSLLDGPQSKHSSKMMIMYGGIAGMLFLMALSIVGLSPSSSSSSSSSSQSMNLLGHSHSTTLKNNKNKYHHDDHYLSSRASIPPVRDDMMIFMDAKMDEYHPQTNPNGKMILLVAENRLLYTELSQKLYDILLSLQEDSTTTTTFIPEWVFDYNDMRGQSDFQIAMAHMMESSWMAPAPVRPDALLFGSGAGTVLDSLSWTLAENNDGVLVTGPIYAAFPGDFGIHGGLHLEIIPTYPETNYEPSTKDLEHAYHLSKKAGHTPKILLICQPHNPTGAVYSHTAMHRMILWALEKGMHVVSDEIYGNSVFPGTHVTSAAEIMYELYPDRPHDYLGDRVHIVAGLSKDWGASGLRVGTLMTHNSALYDTMAILSYYNGVSQLTQWAFTLLLEDVTWRDWYIAENQRRLKEVFDAAKDALSKIDVPVFAGAQGTMFAWADFSAHLRPGQTERELWMELYDHANLLFTLGESFHGEKPGMFRIVYTWPHGGVEAMNEMGRRLVEWNHTRS